MRRRKKLTVADLAVGMKVTLKANKQEGWRQERAKVLDVPHEAATFVVAVYPPPALADDDDGLREITLAQIEKLGW